MKCPDCGEVLEKVEVAVEGAKTKAISYQCKSGHIQFEKESATRVIKELKMKETPLQIKQKIVKLSGNRLGFYFNQHVVRSLDLKPGEEIFVSVPDKKHVVLKIED